MRMLFIQSKLFTTDFAQTSANWPIRFIEITFHIVCFVEAAPPASLMGMFTI